MMPAMKLSRSLLRCLALLSAGLFFVSCASTDEDDHGKPVPPSENLSALPWDRPQTWEGNTGMAAMMPQSH